MRSFDEAFQRLTHAVLRNWTGEPQARHLPCQQSVTGSYLWEHRRSEYAWHIQWRSRLPGASFAQWSHPKAPLIQHRCAQIHVASHLGCWGEKGRCIDLRHDGANMYITKAFELLVVSLCG